MKKPMLQIGLLGFVIVAAMLDGIVQAKEPAPKLVGGNSPVAVTQKEVVAAANFAIQEQTKEIRKDPATPEAKLSLVKIVSAEQQVVAGMNYHLKLKVKLDGKEKTAAITVWSQPWNKEAPNKLTAWAWE